MSRMLRALENLEQKGQQPTRVKRPREALAPRVATTLRSKVAADAADASPAGAPPPPAILFSAPRLEEIEHESLSIHAPPPPSLPANAKPAEVAIVGGVESPATPVPASSEDRMNAVFAGFASQDPSMVPFAFPAFAPVAPTKPAASEKQPSAVEPAQADTTPAKRRDDNAIRPTRVDDGDERSDISPASEPTPESLDAAKIRPVLRDPTRLASDASPEVSPRRGSDRPRPTVWELESSRELADPVKRNQYLELLRGIYRDVPGTNYPTIGFCGVESGDQTSDAVYRVATMASRGGSTQVLIVDANQTTPRLTDELDLTEAIGLVDALARDVASEEIVRATSQSGIDIVPLGSGVIDHLGQARGRLAHLMQGWKSRYSLVLIDAGAMSNPLAAIVGAGCDGAYVVVALGTTVAANAEKLVKRFRDDGVNLLGCVVLQSPPAV